MQSCHITWTVNGGEGKAPVQTNYKYTKYLANLCNYIAKDYSSYLEKSILFNLTCYMWPD